MAQAPYPMEKTPRILLIKPLQNRDTGQTGHPLGLMYISAWLKRHGYNNVRVVDMMVDGIKYHRLAEIIRGFAPDVVGISALSWESRHAHRVAALAKECFAEVPVIAGGPYPSAYYVQVLEDVNIDAVAKGEGENIMLEIVRAIEERRDWRPTKGLTLRGADGEIVENEAMPYIDDLDDLPLPDWNAVPLRRYKRFNRFSRTGTGDYMSLFTSRACPFHCNYCHNIFGKSFRKRTPQNVLFEMRTLVSEYGIREFEIYDDIFNFDVRRAKEICRLIIESELDISFTLPNGIRGDMMDEELCRLMAQAGCRFMSWAIETASPRLQKQIRKHNNLDKVKRNIEYAVANGIYSHGFFMLGFPTETREELQMTIDFLLASQLHSASVFTVNPFEGTQLAEQAKAMGKDIEIHHETNYFTDNVPNLTDLPTRELLAARRRALRQFYLNPRRLLRFVTSFPTPSVLVSPIHIKTFARRMVGGH